MKTPQKTTYYLIIETTGDLTRKGLPTTNRVRGIYSTQAKVIAELFRLCTHLSDEGAIFVKAFMNENNHNPDIPISEMIHSQTHDGETSILGYIPNTNQIFELQTKAITLDMCSLITI